MTKITLGIVFIVGAFGFLINKFFLVAEVEPIRFLAIYSFLPAILLGCRSWWRHQSFARSWSVVACALLAWAGLLWAGQSQSLRGLYIAGLITFALPIGALIAEHRAWWFCAKVYVYGNVAAIAYLFWCQYWDYGGRVSYSMMRIGCLRTADKSSVLTNPNQVGAQLALAAILAFLLYLRGVRSRLQPSGSSPPSTHFGLWWTVILSLGCVLTASRGAFASWAAGMGLVLFLGTRGLPDYQLRDLTVFFAMGILAALLMATISDNTPWARLYNRVIGGDNTSIGTMGNRTQIWANAMNVWWQNPEFRLIGTGTGQADTYAGINDPYAARDDYGQLRRNCHSSFIEWIVSYGIVGIVLGICTMVIMGVNAWKLDHSSGGIGRTAILVCVALSAACGVVIRRPDWIPTASLVLAMLSMAPKAKSPMRRPHFLDRQNDADDSPFKQAA